MSEFIDNRFWAVLPYRLVRSLPQLQLSPAAVKEERQRKPRLLCDHSWYPVNEKTLPHAPPEAMQFGGTLQRVLRAVRHANPRYGPVHLSKYDIKDGYYRMFLNAGECPRLAIILPRYDGEEQLIAIPMACTMGWVESPPSFCSMSETITDLTNARAKASPRNAKPHRLEALAGNQDRVRTTFLPEARGDDDASANLALSRLYPDHEPAVRAEAEERAPASNQMLTRPVNKTDVFVDDFLQLGQGSSRRLKTLRRHLLHCVDEVLAEPRPGENRNEAVSLKKLLSGDGSWNTRKLILGWIVDTVRQTIELPPHRKQALEEIFTELRDVKRISAKKWRSMLGKLRFVAAAIPGSIALFSALQWAQNQAGKNRVRLNGFVRSSVDAFGRLAASLCARPTHLAELVPQQPTLLGATDAARAGMGGMYFDHTGQGFYWRHPFPEDVQASLITADNPNGHITNSDLEQAALLAQRDVMAHSHPVRYATLENFCDNTPAVSRDKKGAVSAPGPAAYLCQIASDHQRQHRYHHVANYLPGPQNVVADDTSRLQRLTAASFHSHMSQQYPQQLPWRQQTLQPAMASLLTCALLCKPQTPLSCPRLAPAASAPSKIGPNSATSTGATHPSVTSQMPKPGSATSSSTDPACAAAFPDKPASLSELVRWRTPSWPWARASPYWVSRIPERKLLEPTGTIPYWLISSKPSPMLTTLPLAHTPPTSPSSNTCPKCSTPRTLCTGAPTSTPSTSASSASTGSCAPPSTSTPPATAAPKPSGLKTSPSWWAPVWLPPLTPL
jgi:hypothetical protein